MHYILQRDNLTQQVQEMDLILWPTKYPKMLHMIIFFKKNGNECKFKIPAIIDPFKCNGCNVAYPGAKLDEKR